MNNFWNPFLEALTGEKNEQTDELEAKIKSDHACKKLAKNRAPKKKSARARLQGAGCEDVRQIELCASMQVEVGVLVQSGGPILWYRRRYKTISTPSRFFTLIRKQKLAVLSLRYPSVYLSICRGHRDFRFFLFFRC